MFYFQNLKISQTSKEKTFMDYFRTQPKKQYKLIMYGYEFQRERTFEIATRNGRGWVHLQLVKVYDEPTAIGPDGPVLPNPAYYDPTIHTKYSGSHFSDTWVARWSNELQTYELYGAFGYPGERIPLSIV